MHTGKMVFAQLMQVVSEYDFRKCVERYGGDHRVRNFTCWDHVVPQRKMEIRL
jgi:hypothetical protein